MKSLFHRGKGISRYEYRLTRGEEDSGWLSTGSTSPYYTISNPSNPRMHNPASSTVQVRAVNSLGAGEETAAVTVSPQYRPAPPVNPRATGGERQAPLRWDPPGSTPGDVVDTGIESYEYRQDGGSWASADNAGEHTVTGLVPNNQYSFEKRDP